MATGIFGNAGQPLPGMFGARRANEEQEEKKKRKPGIADVLASIFTGPEDPRLDPEQAKTARQQALIDAGLATMAIGGRTGLERASLLEAIAGGAMAGRQSGSTRRRSQVIGELAGQDPNVALPQFRAMFVEALQAGDAESARSIATVINAMEAAISNVASKSADKYIYRNVGSQIIVIDKESGQEVARIQGPETAGTLAPVLVQLPDGSKKTGVYDKSIMAFREVGTGNVLTGAQLVDKGATDPYIAAIAPSVGPVFAGNVDLMEQLGPPNIFEHMLDANAILRFMAPEAAQRFNAAADDAISVLILVRSGRQASDRERRMLREALVPRPGDKPQTVKDKIARLRAQGRKLMEAAEAGRAPTANDILPELAAHVDSVISASAAGKTPILDEVRKQ